MMQVDLVYSSEVHRMNGYRALRNKDIAVQHDIVSETVHSTVTLTVISFQQRGFGQVGLTCRQSRAIVCSDRMELLAI